MVVLIGSGLGKQTLMHSMTQISLAMLALGGVALVVWHFQKKLTGARKASS
jgi:hypothetical protein